MRFRHRMGFVLGTAGHVDHGKTTLVRALTGVDTDRLPEEKRRGITIELGFARWELEPGLIASIVDVPGHHRLVHTMIAGAAGMQAALFVVAADEGVMPQTREHADVCAFAGLRRVVVAVTKQDRAEPELADIAAVEAQDLLGGRFEIAAVVPCSPMTGQGLHDLRRAIAGMLRSLPPISSGGRVRLGVDRVFTVKGAGTIVTGTLVSGRMTVEQRLWMAGERGVREVRVRALESHDAQCEAIEAPARVAINLAGVAVADIARGDAVTDDPDLQPQRIVDVLVRGPAAHVRSGARRVLHVGTARSVARVDRVRDLPEGCVARVRLETPIAISGGDPFILRAPDVAVRGAAAVTGGRVLDARPPHRRSDALTAALAAGNAATAAHALVALRAPLPLEARDLRARLSIPVAALEAELAHGVRGRALVHLVDAWMDRAALMSLSARARSLVAEHARAAPLDRGMPLETLRAMLASSAGMLAAEAAIRLAACRRSPADVGVIEIHGDVARREDDGPLDVAIARALAIARSTIEDAGLHGAGEHAIKEATGAADVRPLLAKLVRDGVAAHVSDLWMSQRVIDAARAIAVERLRALRRMSVIDFKQATGLPRKQAILLLELFDREGLTRRDGDARVLAPPPERA